jgi:serine/threonine protein kinase/formylglycine-generating enzyme required for sulfatase activity
VNEEAAYEEFVEGFFASGERSVPESWPRSLRERCLFFLRLMGGSLAGGWPGDGSTFPLLGKPQILGVEGDAAPPVLHTPAERYVIEQELARGGMGKVLLAYDRDFRRRIAMKTILPEVRDAARASRFIQEAQTTSQLEHPNIGPVYDIGIDAEGTPFFTMKWIRGRSLAELLHTERQELSRTRLIQILQQAAMAVHFASSKGVVHRDLKPQNIMIGDFGEVLVVDWGLAKVGGGQPAAGAEPRLPEVSTRRLDEGERTLEGAVQGSLPYMAPEQARGEVGEIDVRTDVFGLGAILYEVLTGTPPYVSESRRALLGLARRGAIEPPSARAPDRAIPRLLEDACLRALAFRKEDRFRDAGEFHQALEDYLEGLHSVERQEAEAGRLLWVAEKLKYELLEARGREAALLAEESALHSTLAPHDPEEKKRPAWELAEKREAAREVAGAELSRATAAYLAVLSISPQNRTARQRLAELFHGSWMAAEERGERALGDLYKSLVAQYDDGLYAAELSGEGLLQLDSTPAGATVLLSRFEERGIVFKEGAWETIGTTPIERKLPQGSYCAILWKEGFSEVRYPFVIDRRRAHAGKVRLAPAGSIPERFLQVPGGETIAGTDVREFQGAPRRRVMAGDLFAGRFPVTFGEYCEFLNDRFPQEAAPPPELQSFFGKEEYIVRGPHGFEPVAKLDPRMAVNAVTHAAATAYASWLGEKLGKPVRLLREEEWERCARGADGRLYPWGNGFDWALCKGALSKAGEPFPDPVGSFPRDVSVFGVRDLAGTVRELCDGWAREGYRLYKGGSWFNPFPFVFRADFRTMLREGNRTTDAGFRVCYDG